MQAVQQFVLIDDDPSSNFLCKMVISKTFQNATVLSFTRAAEGLRYLQEVFYYKPVPTVLFLDISMPVQSGWEVLKTIEIYGEHIKNELTVFMLSSSINPYDREKAKDNSFVIGYLEKPLLPDTLLQGMELLKVMIY
jgi:CheY-like chemotaxis protein